MIPALGLAMLVLQAASLKVKPDDLKTSGSEPPCMLTAHSFDGIGHQLEAKLTCIATAKALGMKYIHSPFNHSAHKANEVTFNEFIGLDKVFPGKENGFFEKEVARKEARHWMRYLEKDQSKCKHNGKLVYKVDSCFDYFWGDGPWPSMWYDVLPEVRDAYFNRGSRKPMVFAKEDVGPKVVLHSRRGGYGTDKNLGRDLPHSYFLEIIAQLRRELTKDGKTPKFYVETDAVKADLREMKKELQAPDVVISDQSADLHEVLHRMITADVLVASDSSLSYAAALIGNHSLTIVPACAPMGARKLRYFPTWRSHPCKGVFENPKVPKTENQTQTDGSVAPFGWMAGK